MRHDVTFLSQGRSISLLDNFEHAQIDTSGATIHLAKKGDRFPLLLLHGYPQTHLIWHKMAPRLAEEFFVVGHDRGGRVAHRMALDHPHRVKKLAVLDIAPTYTMYMTTDKAFATAYYHWFFLIQPYDLPERLIGSQPEYYPRRCLASWSADPAAFVPEAVAEYIRCFSDPATIHASCEDYRAAATIDLQHDEADLDQKVTCPLLALWSAQGVVGRKYNVLETWRERAIDVLGKALPGGHFLPEEAPKETYEALREFLLT